MTDDNHAAPDDRDDLLTAFHGTSASNAPSILMIGLQPRIGATFVTLDFDTAACYAALVVLVEAAATGSDSYSAGLVLSLRVDPARLQRADSGHVMAADGSIAGVGGDEFVVKGAVPAADLVAWRTFDPRPFLAGMPERVKRKLVEKFEQGRAVEALVRPLRFFNPGAAASALGVLRGPRVAVPWD